MLLSGGRLRSPRGRSAGRNGRRNGTRGRNTISCAGSQGDRMRKTIAVIAVCSLSAAVAVTAESAQRKDDILIAIAVDPERLKTEPGFVEPETNDLVDTVKDLRRDLDRRRGVKLCDAECEADVVLHVVRRERRVTEGVGAVGITAPNGFGGFTTVLVPSHRTQTLVLIRLRAGGYERQILGESPSDGWRNAAYHAGGQIHEWVTLNREMLLKGRD